MPVSKIACKCYKAAGVHVVQELCCSLTLSFFLPPRNSWRMLKSDTVSKIACKSYKTAGLHRVQELLLQSQPDPSMAGALPPGAWWEAKPRSQNGSQPPQASFIEAHKDVMQWRSHACGFAHVCFCRLPPLKEAHAFMPLDCFLKCCMSMHKQPLPSVHDAILLPWTISACHFVVSTNSHCMHASLPEY